MSRRRLPKRRLDVADILAWARRHREITGKWPTRFDRGIIGVRFESWRAVDAALRLGWRGLPAGSSLARLLAEHEGFRNVHELPPLTEPQILRWADQHHERTGSWPIKDSGAIPDSKGDKWSAVDRALRRGLRSLPGGSSLPQLLAEHRGVRNIQQLAPLTEEQILQWADAFHERTGSWPRSQSGPVADAPGETWMAVEMALNHGTRGMPGGSSLALLLAEKRGVRNIWSLPDLSIPQLLAWADAFHERTGGWPNLHSGPITEAPEENWNAVDSALKRGGRGLPRGYSLATLLAAERRVRNQASVPRLTRRQILAWADAHHRRTGDWPTHGSGPIAEAPQETWAAIDAALIAGTRGLRPGSSLAPLLARERGRRSHIGQPPLSKKKILRWADQHYQRTGKWPNANSGPVVDAPGEQWLLIDQALRIGTRGLTGGSSLLLLLVRKRGLRHPLQLEPLTEEQIVRWADLHYQRTGSLPRSNSGPIADAPGETWSGLDNALRRGRRGLPRGSSVARLLEKYGRKDKSPGPTPGTNGPSQGPGTVNPTEQAPDQG